MPDQERMYTTQEAAELLGISDSRLRNLIREGKAQPKQQFAGAWVFTIAEIERIRGQRKKAGRPKKS
jgi:predicted site-specific integrase-resolvase